MKNEKKSAERKNTELVFILDRSGSMGGLESDTIGGFNAMIEKQKKEKTEGKTYVTTVLFNSESVTIHDRIPLENVPVMTDREYAVGGCTALLDAIGETVTHIEKIHKYIRPEDVPANTMVVITTDGMENASREYSTAKIRKLVEKKQEEGWEFLFLGANIDAFAAAASCGIRKDRAVNYHADAEGTALNFCVLAEAVSDVCAGKGLKKTWKKKIEEDYENRS